MSLKTNVISTISGNNITVNNPIDIGQLNQLGQNVTDTFNNVLSSGTHSGSTNYSNSWIKADTSSDADSSLITSSIAFNSSSGTLTITAAVGAGYPVSPWANKLAAGRNKLVNVTLPNGTGSTGTSPQMYLRFGNTTTIPCVIYFGGPNNYIIMQNLSYQFFNGNNSGGTGQQMQQIPSFNSTNVYTWCVKTFENLVYYHFIDNTNFPGRVINHGSGYDPLFLAATTSVTALGVSSSSPYTNVYSNFKAQNMDNLLNVICLGDSNTQGDSGTNAIPRTTGQDYIQNLNYAFRDKNVVFTNRGFSGFTSYDFASGGSQDVANLIPNYFVQKAKNVVTLLIGTNDSAGINNAYNLTNTLNNIAYIIYTVKQLNCEIWICTSPGRNDNTTYMQNLIHINNGIRNLNPPPDRIIDLWSLTADPNYYDSTNNVERILPSLIQTDNLHFNPAGHLIISDAISKLVWEEISYNANSANTTVNKTLSLSSNVNPNIRFASYGVSGPNNNTSITNGAKLILYPTGPGAGNYNYQIGIDNSSGAGAIWYGVNAIGDEHRFYNNSTKTLSISGNSGLNVFNNTSLSTTSSSPGGCTNLAGSLALTGLGALQACIMLQGGQYGPPNTTSRTIGTRIVLNPTGYPTSSTDYAIGITTSPGVGVWFGVNQISDHFYFYNNNTITLDITNASTTFGSNNLVSITNGTVSSSKTTGALVVTGGVGISGALFGSTFNSSGLATLNSVSVSGTSTLAVTNTSGLLSANSGLTVVGTSTLAATNISGLTTITNTTASSSSSTGALVISGGLGVAGNVYSNGVLLTPGVIYTQGTNISISSNVISTVTNPTFSGITSITNATTSSSTSTGALIITGGVGVGGALFGTTFNSSGLATLNSVSVSGTSTLAVTNISGITSITNATASSSTSTGALVVTGGTGIGGNLFVGGTGNFAGITSITNATATTSSSTGALLVSGGISSSLTTNSSSATNGGTLTLAGGAAIAKDLYIGQNLIVTGTISSAAATPGSRTTGSLVNTSAVTVNNQILTVNGTNNIYAATFSCTPTAANAVTSFVTNLPNRTSNSIFVYEIIATIQGFNGSVNISNCVCYAVTGSINFQIQFTSIDNTNVHYIQVRANYISN